MNKRKLVGTSEERVWVAADDKFRTILVQYWSTGTVTWEYK